METSHLENTLKMIARKVAARQAAELKEAFRFGGMLSGDAAMDAFEQNMDVMADRAVEDGLPEVWHEMHMEYLSMEGSDGEMIDRYLKHLDVMVTVIGVES